MFIYTMPMGFFIGCGSVWLGVSFGNLTFSAEAVVDVAGLQELFTSSELISSTEVRLDERWRFPRMS